MTDAQTTAMFLRERALECLREQRPDACIRAFDPTTDQDGNAHVIICMTPSADYMGEHFCYTEFKVDKRNLGHSADATARTIELEVRGSGALLLALYDEHHGDAPTPGAENT